jgi:hypothetical protein
MTARTGTESGLQSWHAGVTGHHRNRKQGLHCKDNKPKIRNIFPEKDLYIVHSCICVRFMYSDDRSAYSAAGKYIGEPIQGIYCINRLQTHECGNWDRGRAVSFLGRHESKFLCSRLQDIKRLDAPPTFNKISKFLPPYICYPRVIGQFFLVSNWSSAFERFLSPFLLTNV